MYHPIPLFQRPRFEWQIWGVGMAAGGLPGGAVAASRAAGLDIGEDVGEGGCWDVFRLSEEKRWLLYVGWYVIGLP